MGDELNPEDVKRVADNVRWNTANLVGSAIGNGTLDGTNSAAVAAAIRASSYREFEAALRTERLPGDELRTEYGVQTTNPVTGIVNVADWGTPEEAQNYIDTWDKYRRDQWNFKVVTRQISDWKEWDGQR